MTTTAEHDAVATLSVFIADSPRRVIGFPTKRDASKALAALRSRMEQLEQMVEAARIIDEQIWVPGAASDPDAYHDATIRLREALAALDQEEAPLSMGPLDRTPEPGEGHVPL